jgi:hypothetical protein
LGCFPLEATGTHPFWIMESATRTDWWVTEANYNELIYYKTQVSEQHRGVTSPGAFLTDLTPVILGSHLGLKQILLRGRAGNGASGMAASLRPGHVFYHFLL